MPSRAARTPTRAVRDLLNGDGPPQPMLYVIRVPAPRPGSLFPTSSRTRTAHRSGPYRPVPDPGAAEACRFRSAALNLVHRAYPRAELA
ncbi:hypothetical protein GCM10010343_25270 [Streptomyces avidinii]|nr:hypothetical protein GCM10010343_25270 [Streptomyces avidinii]